MKICNWGRYPVVDVEVKQARTENDVKKFLTCADNLIARGLGRCYGDSALNDQMILSLEKLDKLIAFDEETGILIAEAGVSLSDIIDVFAPRGWFVPVTPGTKFITLGGALAADVHGKNHHIASTFSQHTLWLDILTANGEVVRCSPKDNAELFHATCGGMGLTGIILRCAVAMRRIPSAYIQQRAVKTKNLAEIMEAFEAYADYPFSVAWIDCLKGGEALGRSILMAGDFATVENLPSEKKSAPFTIPTGLSLGVPFDFPSIALNPLSIRAFNSLYYAKTPAGVSDSLVSYNTFFYPLDAIHNWNRIYGKRGFTQYQFVIPREAGKEGLPRILKRISDSGQGSFLAVLKLFGEQPTFTGNISFPAAGYTLALDFPISQKLFPLLEDLDSMVLDYGGRHYLAKDVRISPMTIRRGYGKALDDFLEIKARWDPKNRFTSLQAQRLDLNV